MKCFLLAVAVACCALELGELPRIAAADPPAKAEVVVVGQQMGSVNRRFSEEVEGKKIEHDMVYLVLKLDDRTSLVAVVDLNTLEKEEANRFRFNLVASPWLGIKGQLGLAAKADAKTVGGFGNAALLKVKDGERVVLAAKSIVVIDEKNAGAYPPKGKARVEGKPLCGKVDLKLLDEPTLAVANDPFPLILDGEKSKATAGKNAIRVVGSLKVDPKGLLRLLADEVGDVGK